MTDEPAPAAPRPPADAADVDSLDAIVNALYASVSFAPGSQPDWTRFCSLFDRDAILVRVDAGGDAGQPRASAIEDYVARTDAAIASGALTAFDERELSRRTEVFADLAQVFSTYERSIEAGEAHRGINAVQLVKGQGRWWIVSITWTDETEATALPSRYLPRP